MSNEYIETKGMYTSLILELYPDMKVSTITSHISRLNTTYKDFYLDLKDRKETLELIQDMFIEVSGKDLKNIKEFKDKRPSNRNEFLSVLYRSRNSIPPKNFIDKCKRVMRQYQNLEPICNSCYHYNKRTKLCNYLDTYVQDNFYCKALERIED